MDTEVESEISAVLRRFDGLSRLFGRRTRRKDGKSTRELLRIEFAPEKYRRIEVSADGGVPKNFCGAVHFDDWCQRGPIWQAEFSESACTYCGKNLAKTVVGEVSDRLSTDVEISEMEDLQGRERMAKIRTHQGAEPALILVGTDSIVCHSEKWEADVVYRTSQKETRS